MYNDTPPSLLAPTVFNDLPLWPPVSSKEVSSLIGQLKRGKAPGFDGISPEFLKENTDWWASFLAHLFTYIDATGRIPNDWGMAVVVPFYKKGSRKDPANYRPISLLSVISKLYAKHLLEKFTLWLEQEDIMVQEQAGFRQGRSTMDHCIVLQHLIEKYSDKGLSSLYAAFIDLKAAFDSISRSILWNKLEASTIDRRLLALIRVLYEQTSLRVRCTSQGHLTDKIPTFKGVRQGCMLAPVLFNFYLNDVVGHLKGADLHSPKLAQRPISILLYADDAVILSRTPIGLRRTLKRFASYCNNHKLNINYQKTKVMAFGKRPRIRNWSINGQNLEQVTRYRYLGMIIQASGSKVAHSYASACVGDRSAQSILKFFRSSGGYFVPAALKLFRAKSLSQMLYGSLLGPPSSCFAPLELVQSKFLRAVLQVPKCVSNAMVRLETGMQKVEAKITLHSIFLWIRINSNPCGLLPLILSDDFQSKWLITTRWKIMTIGLSPQVLLTIGSDQARQMIRQRIDDIERQSDLQSTPAFIAPSSSRYILAPASYLSILEVNKLRRAYTLARCSALPSAVLDGRFKKIPWNERLCSCILGEVETQDHVFLRCPFYKEARTRLINPLLEGIPEQQDINKLEKLLSTLDPTALHQIAKFCALVVKAH